MSADTHNQATVQPDVANLEVSAGSDAPSVLRMDVRELVDDWLQRTEQDVAFSPRPVQDLLFELWGAAENEPEVRGEIERWLTLSLTRNLFGADELREALVQWRDALMPTASV